MFKDFEVIKQHLTELAEIINKFKSEAVQLRLIELLFVSSINEPNEPANQENTNQSRKPSKSKKKTKLTSPSTGEQPTVSKKKSSSGAGAVATLVKTFESGYFKEPRTINDICLHCETNLARRIKPNEISGKLGRMVRNGELTRAKNNDNQYVYTSK